MDHRFFRQLSRHVESGEEKDQLLQVCRYTHRHLSPLIRRTGENYAIHGMEVATVLTDISVDPSLLSCAVAHDIPLHPAGDDILEGFVFSDDQKRIIRAANRLRRLRLDTSTSDLDVALMHFAEDESVLLLRLAHRYSDVRNIGRFEARLRKKIARESLYMYSSIAEKLGLHAWRREIENISFAVLHPHYAKRLQEQFDASKETDEAYLQQVGGMIDERLERKGIVHELQARIKGVYSTYRKLLHKQCGFYDLNDRLALRVLVETPEDCYRALGIIHEDMLPEPENLHDFIGSPKENGYRSIHTTVQPLPGPASQPIEIQIRTFDMHRECEFGFAAHYKYKNSRYVLTSNMARADLIRNLENLKTEVQAPAHFERMLSNYLQNKDIVLFDEYNNIHHVKSPVSVLDFAAEAHPRKWLRLKSARINGRLEPFSYRLQNGDIVHLFFSRSGQAKSDWVGFCHRSRTANMLERQLAGGARSGQ